MCLLIMGFADSKQPGIGHQLLNKERHPSPILDKITFNLPCSAKSLYNVRPSMYILDS